MLGSESIEEMFDQPGWSEEEVEDADEKDVNAHSECLLSNTDKNKQFVVDDESGKDVNGKLHENEKTQDEGNECLLNLFILRLGVIVIPINLLFEFLFFFLFP